MKYQKGNWKILFKITISKIKYLDISFIKEVKNLHTEDHKTLVKKTEVPVRMVG